MNDIPTVITSLLQIVTLAGQLEHAAKAIPALAQRVAKEADNPVLFQKRLSKLQGKIGEAKENLDDLLELLAEALPAPPTTP